MGIAVKVAIFIVDQINFGGTEFVEVPAAGFQV
jgi:hypothetical protein